MAQNAQSLERLDAYKKKINVAIEEFLDTVPAILGVSNDSLSVHAHDALAKLREYTMRPGKRLRGALAAAVYDDIKGTKFAEAGISLGVAQELLQSFILVSDDVADMSELRRGKPTIHRKYLVEGDNFRDEHEANMLAEMVSLVTEQIAHLAFLQIPEHPEHITDALYSTHRNFVLTGFGQIDDIFHKIGRDISLEDIIRVYRLKTGYYTFANPLQSGVSLAGARDVSIETDIAIFGQAAGIAFQMHDDYLGVFGSTEATGKATVDDLREGKYTILVQYALHHTNAGDKKILSRILGSPDITDDQLKQAQRIFNDSGATLYTKTEAQRYAGIAKQQLAGIHVWSEQFSAFLADLIDYSVTRKS